MLLKSQKFHIWSKRAKILIISTVLAVSQIAPLAFAPRVAADGAGSPDECLNTTANVIGSIGGDDNSQSADLVSHDVGSGNVVDGVCIKSGNNMFNGNKHSGVLGNGTYENNCYTVSGAGTQVVTVTRIGSGSNCQGISHIDVVYEEEEETGSITIKKNAISDSEQVFHFSTFNLDNPGGFDLVDDSTSGIPEKVFSGLPAGSYSVSESPVDGWYLDQISCSSGTSKQVNGSTLTIDLTEGQDVSCTFTNREVEEPEIDYCDPTQRPGGMSIAQWLAANQVDGSDCFELEPVEECGEFNTLLTNKTSFNYGVRYVIGDTVPSLADWAGDGVLPVTFSEDQNGGSVEITYYIVGEEKDYFTGFGMPNIWDGTGVTVEVDTDCEEPDPGSITIIKDAQPNDGQDFVFTTSISNYEPVLDDDSDGTRSNNVSFNQLEAGEYLFTENDTPGWYLSSVECTEGSEYSLDGSTLSVQLGAGQHVTCTFVNKRETGTLTLHKKVVNDWNGPKDAEDFVLTIHDKDGNLVDYQKSGVQIILESGLYNVGEIQQEGYVTTGWDWWNWTCSVDGWVYIAENSDKECTITNYDLPGVIVVHKEVINNNGGDKKARDFKFKVDHNGEWERFNHGGVNVVTVPAGWHSVYEDEHYAYRTEYEGCKRIYVKNGETKHCYITNNDKAPEVVVKKVTIPRYSSQDFEFKLFNNFKHYDSFTLDTSRYDRDGVRDTYETSWDLKAGWVYIHEKDVEGWDNESVECFKVFGKYKYPVGHPFKAKIGKEYKCYVTNIERGDVVVTKFNDENKNGYWDEGESALHDWDITLDKPTECELFVQDSVIQSLREYSENEECEDEAVSLVQTTSEDGTTTFTNLKQGFYTVGEVAEQREDWEITNVYCERKHDDVEFNRVGLFDDSVETKFNETAEVYVKPGSTKYCFVGNYEKQIEVVLIEECRDDFPYLTWNVTTNFMPTQFIFDWFTVDGNNAEDAAGVLVDTQVVDVADAMFDGVDTYTGEMLWPGTDIDEPDWPGWKLVDGAWEEDPTDFGGNLRPEALVAVTVNPTENATATYPDATEDCVASNGQVLAATTSTEATLAETGGQPYYMALIVSAFLVLGAIVSRTGIASDE